jgi:hypothetical protein
LHLANIDRNVSSILERLGGSGGRVTPPATAAESAAANAEQDLRAYGIVDY